MPCFAMSFWLLDLLTILSQAGQTGAILPTVCGPRSDVPLCVRCPKKQFATQEPWEKDCYAGYCSVPNFSWNSFNKALTCHLTYAWLIFPYFSQNNVQSSERTDSPLALIRQCSSCSHCFYHPYN